MMNQMVDSIVGLMYHKPLQVLINVVQIFKIFKQFESAFSDKYTPF